MTTITEQQPTEVAAMSAPQDTETPGQPLTVEAETPMSGFVAKLADLRARYLQDLQVARDKVKQNFLK